MKHREMITTSLTQTARDINLLAKFLSNPEVDDPKTWPSVDCIVICASSVLYSAEVLFETLQVRPNLTQQLLLCGGIGHSTHLIHEAVANHPQFRKLSNSINGLPEARVLERILDDFYGGAYIRASGCQVLVEDESTNCGSNAVQARKELEKSGFSPKKIILIQDPTMMLRTKASFEYVYRDVKPALEFICWPGFTPRVEQSELGGLIYSSSSPPRLWSFERFIDLVSGEIPRLRDDEKGYGPNGKAFITHVDIPREAEEAWMSVQSLSYGTRHGNF